MMTTPNQPLAGREARDVIAQELGWSPIRQVPEEFASTVDQAEAATLRYHRHSDPEDLEQRVNLWETIRTHPQFTGAPHPFRLDALNRCGIAHLDRYASRVQEADFQAAEECWTEALALVPEDWPERARYLHNLGSLVHTHHLNGGALADLDRAIALLQGALDQPQLETRFLGLFHNTLGLALKTRFERQGTLADLESSLYHGERALEQTPEGHPQRGVYLNNLGSGYRMRFIRTQSEEDVQRAVALLEESLAIVSQEASLPYRLTNLGNALLDRHNLLGVQGDLERAREVHQEAVDLTPEGDQSLDIRLNNLGNSLSRLYYETQDARFVDQAVDSYRRALEHTPLTDPLRASRLYNLGSTLRVRHALTDNRDDRKSAVLAFREACVSGLEYSLEWALGAASIWGDWAERLRKWKEAEEAYGYGQQAIDRLYQAQLLAESQTTWLREARDLAARAAYVHARNRKYRQAVAALERGRARALNDTLTRQEALLEAIPAADRADLERALGRLEQLQLETRTSNPASGRDFPAIAADLHRARQALAETIARVRSHHPEFMPEGLDFADVAELVATIGKPLVYLLTTPGGSLALIVTPESRSGKERVQPVWLNEFTGDDLAAMLYDNEGEPGYLHGTMLSDPEEFQGILERVWPILSTGLISPPAARLKKLGYRRALLVPVGTLTLLPLHAVGADGIAFSYVPSARALKTVFYDRDHIDAPPRFVGVGDPASQQQPRLKFASQEVERIARLFNSHGHQADVVQTAGATRAALRRQLPGGTHLHFACHGRFEAQHPLDSALYLAGEEMLTLQDLLAGGLDVSAARLVTLSACQTGLVDFLNVPDEVVGFPAGFIQAGVPGVIGTLWPVDDVSTTVLLTRFYQCHLVDGMEPGAALHASQMWLRDATADELDLAHAYQTLYEASGKQDQNAFRWMRYFRVHPEVRPFNHPYYWAAFTFSGI